MSAYPAGLAHDPAASWNAQLGIQTETDRCPICRIGMEQHAEIDPDTGDEYVEDGWYVHGSDIWLDTAGEGPDERLHCSDSCRQQAAYQRMTPEQQEAMRTILRAVLDIDAARRKLHGTRDQDSRKVECSDLDAFDAWLDTEPLHALFDDAERVYQAIRGTADNEQPVWAIEVEQ